MNDDEPLAIPPTTKEQVAVGESKRLPAHIVLSFTVDGTTFSFVLDREAAHYVVDQVGLTLARSVPNAMYTGQPE